MKRQRPGAPGILPGPLFEDLGHHAPWRMSRKSSEGVVRSRFFMGICPCYANAGTLAQSLAHDPLAEGPSDWHMPTS